MSQPPSLTCKQLVELVSDYIEGALSASMRDAFEQHISGCDGCDRYVAQMRTTIRLLGRLTEDSIEPRARDRLLDVFRDWKGQQAAQAPR